MIPVWYVLDIMPYADTSEEHADYNQNEPACDDQRAFKYIPEEK